MHALRSASALAVAVSLFLVIPVAVAAPAPSHPLSQIQPTDSNLNMSDNPNLDQYNITNVPYINPEGTGLGLGGTLDMQGNTIEGVGALTLGWQNLTSYPVGCGANEAVQVIGDSLTCVSLQPGGQVTGSGSKGQVAFWLDSENVTGDPYFFYNDTTRKFGVGLQDPQYQFDLNGTANFRSDLRMNGNNILLQNGWLSGDGGNEGVYVSNAGRVGIGTTSLTEQLTVAGNIDVGGGNVTNLAALPGYFQSQCPDGEFVSSVYANGTYKCESSTDASTDTYVNEAGDTMNGSLNMSGQNINNVSTLNAYGNLLSVGATFDLSGNTLQDGATTVYDATNGYIPLSVLEANTITVSSGNQLSGGSTVQLGGSMTLNVEEGAGSGLNADLLDGEHGSYYRNASTINAGTLGAAYFEAYNDLSTDGRLDNNADSDLLTRTQSDSRYVDAAGDTMTGNLNMSQNNLTDLRQLKGFFATSCGPGRVVDQVYADGSYSCKIVDSEVSDVWVNESGDTMTGDLDMGNNRIIGVNTLHLNNVLADSNVSDTLTVSSGGNVDPDALTRALDDGEVADSISISASGSVETAALARALNDSEVYDNISIAADGSVNADAIDSGTVGTAYYSAFNDLQTEGYFGNDAASDLLNRSEMDGRFVQVVGDTMQGELSLGGYNVSNVGNLEGFFGAACSSEQAVAEIYDNGTVRCIDTITDETTEAGLPGTLAINNTANMTIFMDTNNIALEGGWLSGDGGNEGIAVDAQGRVGVGTGSPQKDLDVDGSAEVSSSGTDMEVRNDGDVVITLGS